MKFSSWKQLLLSVIQKSMFSHRFIENVINSGWNRLSTYLHVVQVWIWWTNFTLWTYQFTLGNQLNEKTLSYVLYSPVKQSIKQESSGCLGLLHPASPFSRRLTCRGYQTLPVTKSCRGTWGQSKAASIRRQY